MCRRVGAEKESRRTQPRSKKFYDFRAAATEAGGDGLAPGPVFTI